ncbi:Uncharacterized protein NEOC65_002333 [Neochlamydia sp. AcF65]|uniref:tetratricopeptide repeat protein n=1 Tax=Neochlamydia sp. AcF65 TaxID=2795735 RepID=UPI001BCA4A53|nr:tetratricopeptide repeat protein [Neochlamydia sp. AcF65]MBS4167227.1 Uncharacterized protein [Neochlamydia sp. AcF65]
MGAVNLYLNSSSLSAIKESQKNSIPSSLNTIEYAKIGLKTFAELKLQDWCLASLTCKQWKQLTQEPSTWRELYSQAIKREGIEEQFSSNFLENEVSNHLHAKALTFRPTVIYKNIFLPIIPLTYIKEKCLKKEGFLSKDKIEEVENTYALILKDAAQENDSIQQSFCAEKLGDVYLAKKIPETLLQAAGLYNYAMHLSLPNRQELLKEKLAKIQNLLSQLYEEKPLNYDLLRSQFEGNRQKLKDLRSKIEKQIQFLPEIPAPQVVRELYGEISKQIKSFFKILVKQSIDTLGAEPCEYAMIGFGSLAREEMTPYSDLEFGILIKEDTSINREYFKRLTTLIHLKVINLGETILPALDIPCLKAIDFFDSITPRGFAFDGAGVAGKGCKTPYGNRQTFELIQTPEKMAQYIAKDEEGHWWHQQEPHLPLELVTYTHLLGSFKLTEQYKQALQENLDACYQKSLTLRQYLAKHHLVEEDMMVFKPRIGELECQGMLFHTKNDLYRFLHLALDRLALFNKVAAVDTYSRIDQLSKLGVLNLEAAEKLKEWMLTALLMRLKTYAYYQAQQEMMNPLIKVFDIDDSALIQKQFGLDGETLAKIKKIYHIFIPFYQAMKEFLLGSEDKLKFSMLDENSPQMHGDIALRFFQHEEAKYWYSLVRKETSEKSDLLNTLGIIDGIQGNFKQAIEHISQALEIDLKLEGKDSLQVARDYNNLGVFYQNQGKLGKAANYVKLALKITIKLYGKNILRAANCYNNLGCIYLEEGNLKKAVKYIKQALEIDCKLYGKNHSSLAIYFSNLGRIYHEQGDLAKGVKLIKRALDIDLKLYGEYHPNMSKNYNILGLMYHAQKDDEQAAKYLKQALKTDLKLLGKNHIKIAIRYNNLGSIYQSQGHSKEAFKWIRRALIISIKLFGENHPHVATGYNNLGTIYREQGNFEQGIENAIKALKIRIELFGNYHPSVARVHNNLGTIYQEQGNVEQAAKSFTQALGVLLKVYGANHLEAANLCHHLGQIYQSHGELGKAAKYIHQGLQINIQHYGEYHPRVAEDYRNLGLIYREQGKLKQASNYIKKALKINIKLFSENHQRALRDCEDLGMVYQEQGKLGKALDYTKQALRSGIVTYGIHHPEVATINSNLQKLKSLFSTSEVKTTTLLKRQDKPIGRRALI